MFRTRRFGAIYYQQRVESFQAKEDTTSKWEAKKGLFKICQEIKVQTHSRGLEGLLFYR